MSEWVITFLKHKSIGLQRSREESRKGNAAVCRVRWNLRVQKVGDGVRQLFPDLCAGFRFIDIGLNRLDYNAGLDFLVVYGFAVFQLACIP